MSSDPRLGSEGGRERAEPAERKPHDDDTDGEHEDNGEALNVREEVTKHRGKVAALIEASSRVLAHPAAFLSVLGTHIAWLVLNSGVVPGVIPWDPYPFAMLATAASVEAPFITLLVLMGQHRESRINELRDEVTLQVAFQSERKASAALHLLLQQAKARGAPLGPRERGMEDLEEPLDGDELLAAVQEHLNEAEGSEPGLSPDR